MSFKKMIQSIFDSIKETQFDITRKSIRCFNKKLSKSNDRQLWFPYIKEKIKMYDVKLEKKINNIELFKGIQFSIGTKK